LRTATVYAMQLDCMKVRTPLSETLMMAMLDAIPTTLMPKLVDQEFCGLRYHMLCFLERLPYLLFPSSVGTIRRGVIEALNHQEFFMCDRRCLDVWRSILERVLIQAGDEDLSNLVHPATASIFKSTDSQMRSRVRHVKRCAFVVYTAPKDYFTSKLRPMAEKLVENLRSTATGAGEAGCRALHLETLLYIRVLLLKTTPGFLTPVWPVVLAELIKILTQSSGVARNTQAGSNEQWELCLAALKVADTASLLEIDEFHLHQWMFMPDLQGTPSALAPAAAPDSMPSEANGGGHLAEFQPFSVRLTGGAKAGDAAAMGAPCITARSVSTAAGFVEAASTLNTNTIASIVRRKAVTLTELMRLVEGDFLELPEDQIDVEKPFDFSLLATSPSRLVHSQAPPHLRDAAAR